MDTDSLMYELDTADYGADLEYITARSEDFGGITFDGNRLGHFKDEAQAKSQKLSKKLKREIHGYFTGYTGLSAKLYSLKFETSEGEEHDIMKARGIPNGALKSQNTFATYLAQHQKIAVNYISYTAIKKHRLEMFLERVRRRGVCGVDTKTFRYCPSDALPLGHYRIAEIVG